MQITLGILNDHKQLWSTAFRTLLLFLLSKTLYFTKTICDNLNHSFQNVSVAYVSLSIQLFY